MIHQAIADIPEIVHQLGVSNVVISPGSRSAPLTIAFARHSKLKKYVIPDERSAAFVALGMALRSGTPSVLICTSGSAAYNYAPAVAEAFFQQVPLLVLTADRPPEWIDQWDGQTIHQQGIFGSHVVKSYNLVPDLTHDDAQWFVKRTINEAVNLCQGIQNGPVHINLPFREPLYPESKEKVSYSESIRVARLVRDDNFRKLDIPDLQSFNKILVLCGQQQPSERLRKQIEYAANQVPITADAQSNFSSVENIITHHDLFLGGKSSDESLTPDLLITFGKSIVSKNLKLFLRKNKPTAHWHISETYPVADTFQSLTRVVQGKPEEFFDVFLETQKSNNKQLEFLERWKQLQKSTHKVLSETAANCRFSELQAVSMILNALPDNADVHVSNSMPIRYVNIFGVQKDQKVFVNRGTSGIDGSMSTAVGSAIVSDRPTFLITGDLAFFYDRNGLWHTHLPRNLKIILLNNHGGGIFGMIKGPADQPEAKEYFITEQRLHAGNTANDFGIAYEFATNKAGVDAALKKIERLDDISILEIETEQDSNSKTYQELKLKIASL